MEFEGSVLLVDDEEGIREVVAVNLDLIGLAADHAEDGEIGLEKALKNEYSLVILDVMMPKLGGIEVCRRIREEKTDLPIIMLTEKKEEVDRVLGLELGADDYVTKPFSVPELMARVKNLLRRSAQSAAAASAGTSSGEKEVLDFGRLRIDQMRRKVFLQNDELELSPIEYDLLVFLAQQPGRAFERGELLQAIWGFSNPSYEVNVNTNINRLRRKIEPDAANPTYVLTVRGVGYRFAEREDCPPVESGGEES